MKKVRIKNWVELIAHINNSWMKKKQSELSYPFTGKDFADLKHFAHIYQPWGLMSLWDLYIETENDFNKRTGWSIFQFTRQLPFLLDQSGWKERAKKYEQRISPISEKINEVVKLNVA